MTEYFEDGNNPSSSIKEEKCLEHLRYSYP